MKKGQEGYARLRLMEALNARAIDFQKLFKNKI